MGEKTVMKKLRTGMFLLAAIMVLSAMVPNNACAAGKSKKAVAVTANNAKITKNKFSLTATGTSQLKVTYAGKNVTKKAAYKSSNKKVASISRKGKIDAKKTGSCTITVKYKGKTKKLSLKVTKPYYKWCINRTGTNEIKIDIYGGSQICLSIGYKNSGAKKVTWDNLTGSGDTKYKVSDPSIVSVNENGGVEALHKPGKCTIKVTHKCVSFTVPVTIYEKEPVKKPETTKHTHNWVARTSTKDEWVPVLVTVDDYDTVGQNVYICDCGEKVYKDPESHISAHVDAGENFGGYHTEEYSQVKVGSHTEDHGYYKTVTYTDSLRCSCGEVMKVN